MQESLELANKWRQVPVRPEKPPEGLFQILDGTALYLEPYCLRFTLSTSNLQPSVFVFVPTVAIHGQLRRGELIRA